MFRFIRRLIIVLIILFVVYLMFKVIAPNTTRTLTDKIGSFYITSECNEMDCAAVVSTWEVSENGIVVDKAIEQKPVKIWFRARIRNFFSRDNGADLANEEEINPESLEAESDIAVFTWETQTGQIEVTGEIIIEITGENIIWETEESLPNISDEQTEAQKVIDSLF